MKGPVTQAWTHALTFMQQTVLLAAVRGPDGVAKYHASKFLLRWYRRCILVSSLDGIVLETPYHPAGGSFMGPSISVLSPELAQDWCPMMEDVIGGYLRSLDELPHHYQLHFLHAVEIVGYKHPDLVIRAWWCRLYQILVEDMHLWSETEEQLDLRLGDNRDAWLARNHPATTA